MKLPALHSLRTRLILVALFAAVPAIALYLYYAGQVRNAVAAEVQDNALRLARLASIEHERSIDRTQQLLVALARVPEVRTPDPKTCKVLFADLASQYPYVRDFATYGRGGDVVCSGEGIPPGANASGYDWFQGAVRNRSFGVGEFEVTAAGRPVLVVGSPILSAAGEVTGIVSARLDLSWLNNVAAEAQLPSGSTLSVIDHNGTVLVRYPDPEKWVGRSLPEAPIVEVVLRDHEGVSLASGLDGIRKLFGFTRLRSTQDVPGVYVVVGIPVSVAFATLNRAFSQHLFALFLTVLLVVVAAWVGGNISILRPVHVLLTATQRLAKGDLAVRTGLPAGQGELSQLAHAFDAMAHELEQHVADRIAAERALRESERHFHLLVDGVRDYAIFMLNPEGRITTWNAGAERTYGYAAREIVGEHFSRFFSPRDVAQGRPDEELSAAVTHGQAEVTGWRMRRDGTRLWTNGSLTALKDSAENLIGFAKVTRDLTEQRQAEEQIRKLALVVEQGPTIVVITDLQENIEYVNLRFTEVTGFSAEDVLGTKAPDLAEGLPREEEDRLVGTLFAGGTWRGEFLGRRKDGSRYWEGATVSSLRDIEGNITHFVKIAQDITARKESEAQLGLQVAALEAAANGILITDRDGRITWANPAFSTMTGYTLPEIVGQTPKILKSSRQDAEFYRRLWNTILSGEVWRGEIVNRRKDGSLYAEEQTITPVTDAEGRVSHFVSIKQDVTQRKEAEGQLHRQLQYITAMNAVGLSIAGSLELRATLTIVLDEVITQLGGGAADVLLLNRDTQTLDFAAERGFRTQALRQTRLRLGEGYAGQAVVEGRIIQVDNLADSPGAFARAPFLPEEGFVAYYAAPLVSKGTSKGVLEVFFRQPHSSSSEWLGFLEGIAVQTAIAIDSATIFGELNRTSLELGVAYDATLEGWVRALDLRHKETEGHTLRVTELTVRLARAMGVEDRDLSHIRRGALLHDIGKIGVPDSILLKPGPLTEEEWEVMRRHPVHAHEFLSPIAFLRPALGIPYCHHEKWDGTGYPRGLHGENIPVAARIFAVADVWDALTSDREYRAAWSPAKALDHIRAHAEIHFDPKVVEAFVELMVPPAGFEPASPA